jgi:hypothetical protein
MIFITSISDDDVFRKIDSHYVMQQLAHIDMDVVIVFICANENIRKEDTWKKKGTTYYTIRLPYEQVKQMDDIRPMMLDVVTRKLGISLPGTAAAA